MTPPSQSAFDEEWWPVCEVLWVKNYYMVEERKAQDRAAASDSQLCHSAMESKGHKCSKLSALTDDLMSLFAILEVSQLSAPRTSG